MASVGRSGGGEGAAKKTIARSAGRTHRPASEVEDLVPRHGLVYLDHGFAPRPEHLRRQRVVVSPSLILVPEGELRGFGRERTDSTHRTGAHRRDGRRWVGHASKPAQPSEPSEPFERRGEAPERASSRAGHGWLLEDSMKRVLGGEGGAAPARSASKSGASRRDVDSGQVLDNGGIVSVVLVIALPPSRGRRAKDGRALDVRRRDRRGARPRRRRSRDRSSAADRPSRRIVSRCPRIFFFVFVVVVGSLAGPATGSAGRKRRSRARHAARQRHRAGPRRARGRPGLRLRHARDDQ